jgi:hydroxymethylpyrimidine/phosphomethylpyrimidine kinase
VTPVVCSIGSTDPWNAAGLGLDILALTECGARPVTVVAGVTAQDRHGLAALHAVPPDIVTAQFEALRDAGVRAYRVGALPDAAAVKAVAAQLAPGRLPVVYDPVLAASGGGRFAAAALVARFLPAVTLLTPNLAEAAELTGLPVDDVAGMEAAGSALRTLGAAAVLVKGGHLGGAAIDVLVDERGTVVFEASRLAGTLRGTGCLLACAAAAALARGEPARDAVVYARAFVRAKFLAGRAAGGMRLAY